MNPESFRQSIGADEIVKTEVDKTLWQPRSSWRSDSGVGLNGMYANELEEEHEELSATAIDLVAVDLRRTDVDLTSVEDKRIFDGRPNRTAEHTTCKRWTVTITCVFTNNDET